MRLEAIVSGIILIATASVLYVESFFARHFASGVDLSPIEGPVNIMIFFLFIVGALNLAYAFLYQSETSVVVDKSEKEKYCTKCGRKMP